MPCPQQFLFNRLPDTFVSQGVIKEFEQVKFLQLPPNHNKFSINLSGHEADLVGFWTQEPLFSETLLQDKKQTETTYSKRLPGMIKPIYWHGVRNKEKPITQAEVEYKSSQSLFVHRKLLRIYKTL